MYADRAVWQDSTREKICSCSNKTTTPGPSLERRGARRRVVTTILAPGDMTLK
jgi:hypothetical protein